MLLRTVQQPVANNHECGNITLGSVDKLNHSLSEANLLCGNSWGIIDCIVTSKQIDN